MLYGNASSYYGFFLPAASNVRMSVFAVVQYTILQLSPYPFCVISSPEFHHKEKSA